MCESLSISTHLIPNGGDPQKNVGSFTKYALNSVLFGTANCFKKGE